MSSSASELNLKSDIRFIRAGAGAGKTTTLISACIHFFKTYKHRYGVYPKVIITTFTRKATQEIKERLLVQALQINEAELFQVLNKKSHLQIGTIHGVLSALISQNQEFLDIPADFKIVDDLQVRRFLKKELKNYFLNNLNDTEILEHFSFEDLLTELMKAIAFEQEFQNVKPLSTDMIKKAVNDKKQSALNYLDHVLSCSNSISDKWIEYFQFLQSLKRALLNDDIAGYLQIYDDKPKRPSQSKTKPEIPVDVLNNLIDFFDNNNFDESDLPGSVGDFENINKIFFNLLQYCSEKIMTYKKRSGSIAISDLELLALQLCKNNPDQVRKFAEQFHYIMIDEYQDTSPLQVSILDQLCRNKSHFIVGDPQQSIYLFRGARKEVFANKEVEVQRQGYETEFKMINYRSEPALMNFINDFFSKYSSEFRSMQIKPEFNLNQQFPTQAYFIKSAQRSESVYAHIIQLLNKGVRPSEICVLSRRKSVLFDLAKESKKYGVAVQVQVADGFSDKREILDLIFFLKFLVNPYNSENLIGLLRSPWFSITDEEIIQIRQSQSGQSISFWNQLKKFNIELYDLLSNYIQIYSTKGALAAIEQFLKQTLILVASDYIDESSKREANIWKFYTELSEQSKWPHFSLNDFLSGQFKQLQSDLGSGDGEAVPIISPDRVNFMTIHGSKGLQFQHVIIVGLKENAQTTLGSLVTYDGESKSFCVSILSLENSKRLQTDWSYQIRKKFNQRELEEHDRLLYVAMTRAVRSLALVATETKGHDAHSWFKKINWSIDQFTSSDYKVEFVDEVTLQELGMTRSRDKSLDLIDPLNLSHQSIKQAAVTDLISQSEQFSNKSGQNLHEKLVQDFVKAEKGTDLHRYFESLKYNMVVQNLSLSESETAALQWLQNNSQINLNEILQQGHVEWGFGLRDKDRFIQGQIDAWGVVDNTVFILDYKTGSSSYVDKAIKQLMFYGCCLKKMNLINGTQNVKLVAIYPFEKKVETKSVQFDELEFELI